MLTVGSKGTDVKELQRALVSCGFKCAIDGDYGPQTAKVVAGLQKFFGLMPDGIYGPTTMKALLLWTPHKATGANLSAHFNDVEFACHDGSALVRAHPKLPILLEKLRTVAGNRAIYINSAYRTPAYNKKIGGAENSFHMKGMASDITIKGMTPLQVADLARKVGFGGIGIYNTFTHCDVGPVRSWRG